jgi:hypothetical protein
MSNATASTGRSATAAWLVAVVVILVGSLVTVVPFLLHRGRWRSSVADIAPRPTLFERPIAFPLRPGQQACMNSVAITSDSGLALFTPYAGPGATANRPALAVLLRGPKYRSAATVPAEGYTNQVVFHITPPTHSLLGTVCLLDQGRTDISLEGTIAPHAISRSALTIGGKRRYGNINLDFRQANFQRRLSHLSTAFGHASNLVDRLVPVWLVWVLIVLFFVGMPVGIVTAYRLALRQGSPSG